MFFVVDDFMEILGYGDLWFTAGFCDSRLAGYGGYHVSFFRALLIAHLVRS